MNIEFHVRFGVAGYEEIEVELIRRGGGFLIRDSPRLHRALLGPLREYVELGSRR